MESGLQHRGKTTINYIWKVFYNLKAKTSISSIWKVAYSTEGRQLSIISGRFSTTLRQRPVSVVYGKWPTAQRARNCQKYMKRGLGNRKHRTDKGIELTLPESELVLQTHFFIIVKRNSLVCV